jgi:hypothetical protein
MIYRFTIEIDIQADESPPWSAETIARDYLRHILEESPLHDHICEWHTKHVSPYPVPKPTQKPTDDQTQTQRTWHTQQSYQSPQGATPPPYDPRT